MINLIPLELYSIEPITKEAAELYQISKGYHPCGYGLFRFRCEKCIDSEGRDYYKATWHTTDACD